MPADRQTHSKRSSLSTRRLVVLALLALAACAGLLPDTVTISRSQLDDALARRFPYKSSLLGVFSVEVQLPQLRLMSDQDRLGADFDITLTDRIGRRSYHGALSVDGHPRFQPSDRTLRLDDPHVGTFTVDGLPRETQALVQGYGALLAEQVLTQVPLYTLKPETAARLEQAGVQPGAVHVTPQGLTVTLDRPH